MFRAFAIIAAFALAFTALSMTACDDGGGGGGNDPNAISVYVTTLGQGYSVARGGTLQFYMDVFGPNNPSKAVTWAITTEGKHSGTTISAGGLLSVSASETQITLTVRATSTANTSISGTTTVDVSGGGSKETAIELTENQWANGDLDLPYLNSSVQWFKFTAATQYIHVTFGTLTGLYVLVYDSGGTTVGSETNIGITSTDKYISQTSLTVGNTYYIGVRPYNYSYKGTYRIGFTPTAIAPEPHIPLTLNTWANGDLPTNVDVQWFSFEATASTQYIHVEFGTLTNLYVNVYASSGAVQGSETRLSGASIYAQRSLTTGQTYYIRVRSYGIGDSGTYKIGFNTSATAPTS